MKIKKYENLIALLSFGIDNSFGDKNLLKLIKNQIHEYIADKRKIPTFDIREIIYLITIFYSSANIPQQDKIDVRDSLMEIFNAQKSSGIVRIDGE